MAWHPTWNEPVEERRRPRQWPWSGVATLLVLNIAAFVLNLAFREQVGPDPRDTVGILTQFGALRVTNAYLIYPFITYQFLHAGFVHILINMLILWMLGRHIERALGTRAFVYLFLISGVVGGLSQIGFNVVMSEAYSPAFLQRPMVGASGGVMGILTAFAVLYPRQVLYLFLFFIPLPIEARWLAIGYFILESVNAYMELTGRALSPTAHAAHVGGMVVGFVWVKWGHRIAQAVRSGRPRKDRGPVFRRGGDRDREELDRILDKIHREGVGSLTMREKMFLQEMGGKFRDGP
jgi:membrane associated rhomboid family serine protease